MVLGAIVLLIAFLFWPSDHKSKQSNPVDKNKTQIEIKVKRINIRKEPSVNSQDLGDVYRGEIYTVLSHKDSEEYYWYHIKTSTNIEGYIASHVGKENVELLSGYIDRTPPVIESSEDFLLFKNGEVSYDSVTCTDEYSNCTLSYDVSNPEYVEFTGIDDDNNETKFTMKYYKVYSLKSEYYDNDADINARFSKFNNNEIYTINTTFTINKAIKSNNKSMSYTPIIDLFDENFKLIDDNLVYYNSDLLSGNCINNSSFVLKDWYQYNDLIKGSTLCINYTFDNRNNKIKYVAFGFSSDENYTNADNILASYYSKYFIIN